LIVRDAVPSVSPCNLVGTVVSAASFGFGPLRGLFIVGWASIFGGNETAPSIDCIIGKNVLVDRSNSHIHFSSAVCSADIFGHHLVDWDKFLEAAFVKRGKSAVRNRVLSEIVVGSFVVDDSGDLWVTFSTEEIARHPSFGGSTGIG